MAKTLRAEINVLVLRAQVPMLGQRILESRSNHPPDFSAALASPFPKTGVLNDLLLEIDITERHASGHERHQSAKSITEPATSSGEIVRSESGVDTVINVPPGTWKEDWKDTGSI